MDANQLLLWTVVALCGITVARHLRPRPGYRGWLIKAVLIAAVTGTCHLLAPEIAGYLGAASWAISSASPRKSDTPSASPPPAPPP